MSNAKSVNSIHQYMIIVNQPFIEVAQRIDLQDFFSKHGLQYINRFIFSFVIVKMFVWILSCTGGDDNSGIRKCVPCC